MIQEEVEDDRVLDALLAGGIDPDELENPRCPLCNADTLLAYASGDEYHVITWSPTGRRRAQAHPMLIPRIRGSGRFRPEGVEIPVDKRGRGTQGADPKVVRGDSTGSGRDMGRDDCLSVADSGTEGTGLDSIGRRGYKASFWGLPPVPPFGTSHNLHRFDTESGLYEP